MCRCHRMPISHPPVSATSASCAFKKKITILLNKYKSVEIQCKGVFLWNISVTFPINIGGRRRTRRKSLFISGFTMSILCSRCKKKIHYLCDNAHVNFPDFFYWIFPFWPIPPFDWIGLYPRCSLGLEESFRRILWSQPEIFQSSSLPAL